MVYSITKKGVIIPPEVKFTPFFVYQEIDYFMILTIFV